MPKPLDGRFPTGLSGATHQTSVGCAPESVGRFQMSAQRLSRIRYAMASSLLLWAGACGAVDAVDVTGEISPAHAILASKSQVFHEKVLKRAAMGDGVGALDGGRQI